MKAGDICVVCPTNQWDGKFGQHCLMYTLCATGTYGKFKILYLYIPSDYWGSEDWQWFRENSVVTFRANNGAYLIGGKLSRRAVTKRELQNGAYTDEYVNKGYVHREAGSLLKVLKNLSVK